MKVKEITVGYKGSLNYNSAELRVTFEVTERDDTKKLLQDYLNDLEEQVHRFLEYQNKKENKEKESQRIELEKSKAALRRAQQKPALPTR